jgi:hypothetical protein
MNEYELRFPHSVDLPEEGWWVRLRIYRNELLKESDWAVLSDAPTNKVAWETYRQELRDLPANTKDPKNPNIPAKPNA